MSEEIFLRKQSSETSRTELGSKVPFTLLRWTAEKGQA